MWPYVVIYRYDDIFLGHQTRKIFRNNAHHYTAGSLRCIYILQSITYENPHECTLIVHMYIINIIIYYVYTYVSLANKKPTAPRGPTINNKYIYIYTISVPTLYHILHDFQNSTKSKIEKSE